MRWLISSSELNDLYQLSIISSQAMSLSAMCHWFSISISLCHELICTCRTKLAQWCNIIDVIEDGGEMGEIWGGEATLSHFFIDQEILLNIQTGEWLVFQIFHVYSGYIYSYVAYSRSHKLGIQKKKKIIKIKIIINTIKVEWAQYSLLKKLIQVTVCVFFLLIICFFN